MIYCVVQYKDCCIDNNTTTLILCDTIAHGLIRQTHILISLLHMFHDYLCWRLSNNFDTAWIIAMPAYVWSNPIRHVTC